MGWLRTVTVGRERDKVKPNGKKRSNLPVMAHPLCLLASVGLPAEPASERSAAALFS